MKSPEDLLENCLREMEAGGSVESVLERFPEADAMERLLLAAQRLREAPSVGPSREFRSAARDRLLNLMAAGEASEPEAHTPARPLWRYLIPASKLMPVALSLLVLLSAGIGVAAASGALPSNPLYPVKLAVEELRVRAAAGGWERAELYLAMADERISELASLPEDTPDGPLAELEGRYRAETEAALREADFNGVPAAQLAVMEAELARQEQRLREISSRTKDSTGIRAVSNDLAQLVDAERLQLRERSRAGYPLVPTATLTAGNTPAPTVVPPIPWKGGAGLFPTVDSSPVKRTPEADTAPPHDVDPQRQYGQTEQDARGSSAPTTVPAPSEVSDAPLPAGGSEEAPGEAPVPGQQSPQAGGSDHETHGQQQGTEEAPTPAPTAEPTPVPAAPIPTAAPMPAKTQTPIPQRGQTELPSPTLAPAGGPAPDGASGQGREQGQPQDKEPSGRRP